MQDAALSPRTDLLSAAVRIEWISIVWMVVEAALSIAAGLQASSTALVAFGADSIIELIAAGVLLWRLLLERQHGDTAKVRTAENRAAWVTAIALIALSIYILVDSAITLLQHGSAESSPLGLAIAAVAVILMPILGLRKRSLGRQLNSAALRADAACSLTCGYMAVALLVGLSLHALTGWWWIDGALSLTLLFWLLPEAKEALEGARAGRGACACDDDCH